MSYTSTTQLRTQVWSNKKKKHKTSTISFLFYKLNYQDQKIRQTLACDIQNNWTAISTLLGLISSDTVISPTGDRTSDQGM